MVFDDYGHHSERVNEMYQSETQKIRDQVLHYCIGDGIDLGCGNDKIKADAVGLDLRPLKGVDICGDASGKLAWFEDERFDYVYSSHFLEHVVNPLDCLSEWNRTLKTGGYLVLYLPHRDHYKEYNPDHKHELTQEMVLEWLSQTGPFEIIESRLDVGQERYSFLIVARKVEG